MNIFVEGLQGMGKTTLLQKLSRKYPEYHVYHEGDYCPVELAWCTYMTQREYEEALSAYPTLKEEMTRRTYREGDRYIMEYTRILTDVPGFHRDMERFEIYNGRKNGEEFLNIIRRRYQNLPEGDGGYLCLFSEHHFGTHPVAADAGGGDFFLLSGTVPAGICKTVSSLLSV